MNVITGDEGSAVGRERAAANAGARCCDVAGYRTQATCLTARSSQGPTPALTAGGSSTTHTARLEVFGTAGGGKVIYRDQTFGDVGGGAMLHFRSGLSLEAQATRLMMSALNELACPPFTNAPSRTCGTPIHSGYGPVTQVAFSVNYFLFPQSRIQPYASGGIFRASIDTHYASGNPAVGYVEGINRENYVGVIFGGGIRVSLTRSISLRPEFRYSYTEGFRTARAAVAVGYRR